MSLEEIIAYYTRTNIEQKRLEGNSIEKLRTMDVLLRLLPPPPAKILDAGAATGAYSFFLQEKGYDVYAVDVTPSHIEQLHAIGQESGKKLAGAVVADARELPFANDFFDAILEFGPLYHLPDATDRAKALQEAHRLLKPAGMVAVAGISRYASFMDGYFRDFVADPEFLHMMQHDMETGNHENHSGRFEFFTSAYFHHPQELKKELSQSGFTNISLCALEGIAEYIPGIGEKTKDEKYLQTMLNCLRFMETDESVIGMSPHFIAIGYK